MATAPQNDFWTPERWRSYCERESPYRRYKTQRDRKLAIQLLQPRTGQRVLEVGCGYGRISGQLLAAAKIHLVGVDRGQSMLLASRQSCQGKVSLCRADAHHLPFPSESFDAVLCSGVLMHLTNQRLALRELCRVLKRGGRMVVSGNNLLSPFSVLRLAWGLVRTSAPHVFRLPSFYRRCLTKLGIQVRSMAGDTLLAVGMCFPGTQVPLLPKSLFSLLAAVDQWIDRPPFNYLAYEVWFMGIKE